MKKIVWTIILIISLAALGIASYFVITSYNSGDESEDYIETNASTHTEEYADNHGIKWDKLQKKNKDVYAWIYVPKTKVDYVVLQPSKKEDDLFYLNRNLNKKYEFAGSIFSEKMNSKTWGDPVTVLYGHNMLNGSMFATLHRFEDKTFFKKNTKFYIYTPTHRYTYKVYAAYTYDDRHIMNSFDFSKKKDLKKYQKSTLKPKSIQKNVRKVKLDKDSKIVTLSTCTNGNDNTRFLVQGLLIKKEKSKH